VQHKLLVGYQQFMAPCHLTCCPKTSVTSLQYMLCNIPEKHRYNRNHSYLDEKLHAVTLILLSTSRLWIVVWKSVRKSAP